MATHVHRRMDADVVRMPCRLYENSRDYVVTAFVIMGFRPYITYTESETLRPMNGFLVPVVAILVSEIVVFVDSTRLACAAASGIVESRIQIGQRIPGRSVIYRQRRAG